MIVTALLNTLRTSFLHIITLLSVIMFVFGIMGYYLFGYGEENQTDWGSFPKSALRYVQVTCRLYSVQPTTSQTLVLVYMPPRIMGSIRKQEFSQ